MLTIYSNSSNTRSQSTWQRWRICILASQKLPSQRGRCITLFAPPAIRVLSQTETHPPALLLLTPRESERLESCCITNQGWWQNIWISHPKRRRPEGSTFYFSSYLLWVETRWRVPPLPHRCCRHLRRHDTDLLWRRSWGCCRSRRALRATNRIRD